MFILLPWVSDGWKKANKVEKATNLNLTQLHKLSSVIPLNIFTIISRC